MIAPDSRDLKEWKEEEMFAYASPSTNSKAIYYIEKSIIEKMKRAIPPQEQQYGHIGAAYYRQGGYYAGVAGMSHYLCAPEIVQELMKDIDFVQRAIDYDATWFLPNNIRDIFVF